MSLILERLKAKQRLEQPEGLTAGELLNEVYEVLDKGEVHQNAKVYFDMAIYATFMCSNCSYHNEKEYRQVVLNYEIDRRNSNRDRLVIHITKTK